jgi:hypothetical protein
MHPTRHVVQNHHCVSSLHVLTHWNRLLLLDLSGIFGYFNACTHKITASSMWMTACSVNRRWPHAAANRDSTHPSRAIVVAYGWLLRWNRLCHFVIIILILLCRPVIVPLFEYLRYIIDTRLYLILKVISVVGFLEGWLDHLYFWGGVLARLEQRLRFTLLNLFWRYLYSLNVQGRLQKWQIKHRDLRVQMLDSLSLLAFELSSSK